MSSNGNLALRARIPSGPTPDKWEKHRFELKVGGPAEIMFRPADPEDLLAFLRNKPADVAVTVIGVGSNLLVRDGGIPGVVLRLGRNFADIGADIGAGGHEVRCGAAALDLNVAKSATLAGLAGLEFLSGVPGSIGGALRMNAGAYGKEIKDVLVEAEVADPTGTTRFLGPEELGFGYRHCAVPETWLFIGARLRGHPDDPRAIARRMAEIQEARSASQPIRTRTGGSTFKNPPGKKAWRLIESAKCRGLTRGDAMVSEQHCKFLINRGSATAADLEALGEEVRARVLEAHGISLEWEIRRIGIPGSGS